MNQILISDLEQKPLQLFRAPADIHQAKQLWIFLVENLQPGLFVELSSFDGAAELTRPSGAAVPVELYKKIMETRPE